MDDWKPTPTAQISATWDIGFSLQSAMACSTMRSYGHEALGDLWASVYHSHHAEYFLDGLRKLGLDSEESDAIKAAKYHTFSNLIGGILGMGYAEESRSKAWVFYNTSAYFDSPLASSVSAALMRPEEYAKIFRVWHASNGPTLGNRRLGFVFTHMMFRGDPYDAGYWMEYDHDLGPDEIYRENWGETPPPMTLPEVDRGEWPDERWAKAACNYHYPYIGEMMRHMVPLFGILKAAEIVEHAYRMFLYQRRRSLAQHFDVDLTEEYAAARLLKRFHQVFREDVAMVRSAEGMLVEQKGSYLSRFLPDPLPVEIEAAITAAWDGLTRLLDPGITVRQTASLAAGDGRQAWIFERAQG